MKARRKRQPGRLWAFLLMFVMVVGMLPVTALADEGTVLDISVTGYEVGKPIENAQITTASDTIAVTPTGTWLDGSYKAASGNFEVGKQYCHYAVLKAAESATLPSISDDNIKDIITVNGVHPQIAWAWDKEADGSQKILFFMPLLTETVDSLSMTINNYKTGNTWAENNVVFDDPDEIIRFFSAKLIYKGGTGGQDVEVEEPLKTGAAYQLYLYVYMKDGHIFDVDTLETNDVSVNVNGQTVHPKAIRDGGENGKSIAMDIDMPVLALTLPIQKTVNNGGNVAPPAETFEFEITDTVEDSTKTPADYGITFGELKIDTTGEGEFTADVPVTVDTTMATEENGWHRVNSSGTDTLLYHSKTFYLTEKNDGATNWTYDNHRYAVTISYYPSGNTYLKIHEPGSDATSSRANFNNTYTCTAWDVTVPITKKVVKGGNVTPPEQDFKFEVISPYSENVYVTNPVVATNGAGSYEQGLVIKVTDQNVWDEIQRVGFFIREKQETAANWTYSDSVYYVKPSGDTTLAWTIYPATEQMSDNGLYYVADESAAVDASFTNTYTRNTGGGGGGGGVTRYTLTYESNGGTKYPSETYPTGKTVELTKKPTREGYDFTGWYSDKGTTNKITSITMNGNKTVYAGWDFNGPLNAIDHVAYVHGYTDGTVGPNRNITRAETAVMLYRLLTPERSAEITTTSNSFSDVSSSMWYNKEVSSMANGGYVTGYVDGTFGGEQSITRAEFVTMMVRFINPADGTKTFTDVPSTYWAYKHISTATAAGWIAGYSDGSFGPENPITRAEAMTIINRVLNRGVDKDSELLDFKKWPDNKPSDWFYYDVIEATNEHEYTGSRPSENWTSLRIH